MNVPLMIHEGQRGLEDFVTVQVRALIRPNLLMSHSYMSLKLIILLIRPIAILVGALEGLVSEMRYFMTPERA